MWDQCRKAWGAQYGDKMVEIYVLMDVIEIKIGCWLQMLQRYLNKTLYIISLKFILLRNTLVTSAVKCCMCDFKAACEGISHEVMRIIKRSLPADTLATH